MPLEEGTRLGLYEVIAPLGAGGMGEVYRVRDTKLGRDVAIKVLPEHFAADKERMARFEREARVLASLNHPNIAAVYGLEEDEGFHYLVMELVPGESLAAKIQKGPLPVADVLAIARQLIDALEAAHESGVIHRDLKPANIQITPDGHVKVLDFGLAKVETGNASSIDTSLSPTMTRDGTQAGIILGTAPYMSPEQARGLPVDKRSDIFSFGCVVFEMLTGHKAFEGELVSDVMAAVIKSEPKWSLLPRSASRLSKLLGRCLEKDPKKRLRDIGDARVELDEEALSPVGVGEDTDFISRRRALVVAAVGSLVVAIVTGLLVARWAPSPEVRGDVTRFKIEVPGGGWIAVSPDGRTLVHAPRRADGVHVRSLDSWESRVLQGVETQRVLSPFFSPDGKWLGFVNAGDGDLYKIAIEGGAPIRVSDIPEFWTDSSWAENGTILLSGAGGIWEVDDTGGSLRPLFSLPENEGASAPVMLPGGGAVLFQHIHAGGESVAIGDLRSGGITTLVPDGQLPRCLPTDHILYAVGSTLMGAPFDAAALALTGESVAVIEGIGTELNRRMNLTSTTASFAVSPAGTLAYIPDAVSTNASRTLLIVDPGEAGDAGLTVVGNEQITGDLRLSPDGTRLAVHFNGGENDIWIYEFARDTMSRLTLEPGEDETPVWSPDGRFVAFAGQRQKRAIFRVRADGSEPPERLWESEYHAHVADWSPDGRWLVMDIVAGPHFDLWILGIEDESDTRPLLDSRFDEQMARISPDGRYFAYVSNESGREEVYLQRFPDLGDKRQISNAGGTQPIWSRDGRRILYRSDTHVMAVEVSSAPPLDVSAPEPLVEDTFMNVAGAHTYYDVMPDGKLIMLEADGARQGTHVNVVVNWFQELEARVPR